MTHQGLPATEIAPHRNIHSLLVLPWPTPGKKGSLDAGFKIKGTSYVGLVKVAGEIGRDREELSQVEFLVDTGSLFSMITPALAAELGIDLPVTANIVTANSARLEVPVGLAYLRLQEREGGIMVGAMEVPMPLLGATSLQILGLKVNPVEEPWSTPGRETGCAEAAILQATRVTPVPVLK